MNNNDPKQNLLETLQKFETVMMTTRRRDGKLHARPMAMAKISDDYLWFVAARESTATAEALADAFAVITAQDGGTYACVNGVIEVIVDPVRVRTYWRDSWTGWFPKGKEDPDLVLLRMRPTSGEYWTPGGDGLRHFFDEVQALLNGDPPLPNVNEIERHAHVRL